MATQSIGEAMMGGGERSPERINAEQWNSALLMRGGGLLQSWEWGEFQQRFGRRVTFLAMSEDTFAWDLSSRNTHPDRAAAWHDLDLQALLIEHRLPLGLSYIYVPRGPVLSGNIELSHEELFERFGTHIREMARSRGTAFIRIEPGFTRPLAKHATAHLKRLGFVHLDMSVQPKNNLIIDLTLPDKSLQRHMRSKTRYNIKVAQKHEVVITSGPAEKRMDVFLPLIQETAKQQDIRIHDDKYYRAFVQVIPHLGEEGDLLTIKLKHRLYIAEYKGEPIATALIAYFGNRATYLHGGSTRAHRNVMASYLLHWTIIKDAKELGYTQYDFGGIDQVRWPGITRFKRGFAGWVEKFPGLYEMPLNPIRHKLYRMLKMVKR